MSFLIKSKCILKVHQTKKTDIFFEYFVSHIKEIFKIVKTLNIISTHTKISSQNEIPFPQDLSLSDFLSDDSSDILTYIKTKMIYVLNYQVQFIERNINIIFVVKNRVNKKKYDEYVNYMLVWLYLVSHYSNQFCFSSITIYVYHTIFLKTIPKTQIDTLDIKNINTAFTTTCPKSSEIVIFREEEWFKVFIHETMHNFALDFSDMDVSRCHNKILQLFPVNSEVNLFEAYTEFWARIMNIIFCSYINAKKEEDILTNIELFMQIERTYSSFQMNKVLNYMGLDYSKLYLKNKHVEKIRNEKYKENTNVLSYYILTNILLYNYQEFFIWCYENNTNSIIQFNKTQANLMKLCDFIEGHYKTRSMIQSIKCCNNLLVHLKQTNNKDYNFLIENLRMTICEFH
jgi:hypothetical protein